MDNQILSVSEFNALVNQTLEFAYPRVTVEGEISEARPTKHFYFVLKDAEGSLRCIKWGPLRDPVEDGMKVRITGRPKLHSKFGFSFIADTIEPAGIGSIQRAFELLRAKLEKEGLFAEERKRPIPVYPKTIGIVSSVDAAGYKDFLKIINDRWVGLEIRVANVQVQGANAPGQIVNAIDYFNQLSLPPDVLAVVRGGGALEDLQAFNSEEVVRAIAASRAPTVVGVGHEVDVTLADLAADVRGATPTDAATKIVPSKQQIIEKITQATQNMSHSISLSISSKHQEIQSSINSLEHFVYIPQATLVKLEQRMESWLNTTESNLARSKEKVVSGAKTIKNIFHLQIQKSKWEVVSSMRALRSLDPTAVLRRGYAIPRVRGKVVRKGSDVSVGDIVNVQLSQDVLDTQVKSVRRL